MRARCIRSVLSVSLLLLLSSCGELKTIIAVYADGTASLTYQIEAPISSKPVLSNFGQGKLHSLTGSEEADEKVDIKALIDSVCRTAVVPYLSRAKEAGRVVGFSIKDSTRTFRSIIEIGVQLPSIREIGPFYTAFRRDIPLFDSLYAQFSHREGDELLDSITVVDRGDSLELQIHHFWPAAEKITREDRLRIADNFLDSLFSYSEDRSKRSNPMGKLWNVDSLRAIRDSIDDNDRDSIGRALVAISELQSSMVRPKIALLATTYLSNNASHFSSEVLDVDLDDGILEFQAEADIEEVPDLAEPIRQWFRVKLPAFHVDDYAVRQQWRQTIGWCDECEKGYRMKHFGDRIKVPNAGITFLPLQDSTTLVQIECGSHEKNELRMYANLDTLHKMPMVELLKFDQTYYVYDPGYEYLRGKPHLQQREMDLIAGTFEYESKKQQLTIKNKQTTDRFQIDGSTVSWIGGSYKNYAGQTIHLSESEEWNRDYHFSSVCSSYASDRLSAKSKSTRTTPPPPRPWLRDLKRMK